MRAVHPYSPFSDESIATISDNLYFKLNYFVNFLYKSRLNEQNKKTAIILIKQWSL